MLAGAGLRRYVLPDGENNHMRIIVYGVGAIGGAIAARLALTGTEVAGIARGRMLEAIRQNGGLTLVTAEGTDKVDVPCVGDPSDLNVRADDVVIMAMKSQDMRDALRHLRAAGYDRQPVVCAQNGVDNEREALRLFPNVYGMTVMVPAQYTEPGVVVANGVPKFGLFDLGCYPTGTDAATEEIAVALNAAGFHCMPDPDVMRSKYAKLLQNIGNIIGASLGAAARRGPWYDAARKEADAAYAAAGIVPANRDPDSPRRSQMKPVDLPGNPRIGSSTQQSLMRGSGSVETDFLNGEIALLGRLYGVPTPVNAAFCRVAERMVREGIATGAFPEEDLAAMVAAEKPAAG